MPRAEGYESQIMPQDVARSPRASEEMFGGGIGAALGQAGDQLHRSQVRGYQIEKQLTSDREAAAASHAFALHRQTMDGIERDRQSGAPDGYATDIMEANEAGREAVLGGITDPRLQRQYQAQWDEYSTGLNNQSGLYEQSQRSALTVRDKANEADLGSGRILRDPSKYGEELTLARAGVAALTNLTPEARAKLDDYYDDKYGTAALRGQKDPVVGKAAIASGEFDFLGADKLAALDREFDTEIHSRQVAARTEAAAAKTQMGAQAGLMVKQAGDNQLLPDADFATILKDGEGVLSPETLYDVTRARMRNQINREYAKATPQDMAGDLATLDAKIAQLGEKAGPDLIGRRDALQAKYRTRHEELGRDPLGFAAANGIDVPAIDWTNPPAAAVQQRSAAAHAAAALTGTPPVMLRPDEVAQFRARMETGRGGRFAVLGTLDHIGDDFDRAAAARQLAPDDKAFQHLAQLDPDRRPVVVAGQEELKVDPHYLEPTRTNDKYGLVPMYAKVDREIDEAMKAQNPADIAAVKATAREWLAGHLKAQGFVAGQKIFENTYRVAVTVALGGRIAQGGQIGGVGHWGERPFVLPDGYHNTAFGNAVRDDAIRQTKAGRGPVNPDGTPFQIQRAVPVMIAPNRYRWETAVGPVTAKGGGDFITVLEPRK